MGDSIVEGEEKAGREVLNLALGKYPHNPSKFIFEPLVQLNLYVIRNELRHGGIKSLA